MFMKQSIDYINSQTESKITYNECGYIFGVRDKAVNHIFVIIKAKGVTTDETTTVPTVTTTPPPESTAAKIQETTPVKDEKTPPPHTSK